MSDEAATAVAGKGKRVVGTFIVMIGAGMILDAHVLWIGGPVMLAGALLLAWGGVEIQGAQAATSTPGADVVVRIAEPTESDS